MLDMLLADDDGAGTPGEWSPDVEFVQPGDDLSGRFEGDDVYWVPVEGCCRSCRATRRPARGSGCGGGPDAMADQGEGCSARTPYLVVEYNPENW